MRLYKVPWCWAVKNTPAGPICPCSAHLQQGWDAGVPGGQLRLRSPRGRHSGEPCSAQHTVWPQTPGHSPGAPGWQPTTCGGKQGSAGQAGPTSLVMVDAQHPLGAPQWDLTALSSDPAEGLAHVGSCTDLETSSPWWVFGYMYTCVCKSEVSLNCHLLFNLRHSDCALICCQFSQLLRLCSYDLLPSRPATQAEAGGNSVPVGTGSAKGSIN